MKAKTAPRKSGPGKLAKILKLFNGRGAIRNTHLYVAAYSKTDAARILTEAFGVSADKPMYKTEIGRWVREINCYWGLDCWGTAMDGINPARGVWEQNESLGFYSKPFRIWPREIGKWE